MLEHATTVGFAEPTDPRLSTYPPNPVGSVNPFVFATPFSGHVHVAPAVTGLGHIAASTDPRLTMTSVFSFDGSAFPAALTVIVLMSALVVVAVTVPLPPAQAEAETQRKKQNVR